MSKTLTTPWFDLNKQNHEDDQFGEHLIEGNPFAKSVAAPLFQAGIQVAGMVCRKGYKSERLHLSGCHNILLLLQGELSVQHNDNIIYLKPGDISYTSPSTQMLYLSKPKEITWWIYFKISDTPNWNELKKNGSFVESYESGALMFLLTRRILDAHKIRNIKSMETALDDSHILLRLLRRLISLKKRPSLRMKSLSNLVTEISKQPELNWNQTNMAKKLFVSARTLLRLFRSEYGCAPKDMIIQQRLIRAMQTLSSTDCTVEETAHQSGYENVSSFCRTFLKQVGVTPSQYRRNSNADNDFKI